MLCKSNCKIKGTDLHTRERGREREIEPRSLPGGNCGSIREGYLPRNACFTYTMDEVLLYFFPHVKIITYSILCGFLEGAC